MRHPDPVMAGSQGLVLFFPRCQMSRRNRRDAERGAAGCPEHIRPLVS
jgi:hypothetical protein